jgi:hypothetical protein
LRSACEGEELGGGVNYHEGNWFLVMSDWRFMGEVI